MKRYIFLIGILLLLSTYAFGHSWFDSWCCNYGRDCLPVPCEQIDISNKSYLGEVYQKMYPSQDQNCYACKYQGKPRCLYVQTTS